MTEKYRKLFWCVLILADLAFFALLAFAGLQKRDYSVNQRENSYLIGSSYMTMNNEFYRIIAEEINGRIEAKGDRLMTRDPALSVKRQIEQIGEMLEAGIDALVITPVDWESLTSILRQAREQGVHIVVVDTNVSDEELADCTITSDNYHAGVIIGEYFLTRHSRAKVVVMTHEATKSGQERVQGFLDSVLERDGIEIAARIECEGQLEIAMPKLQEAIDDGLEFDSVFCLNDPSAVGAVAALDENRLLEKVEVYGVDASPDAKALISEGMMTATAAQFPSRLGQAAADAIYRLLAGEKVEKNIQIPVDVVVTKENVEEYGIDRWQ